MSESAACDAGAEPEVPGILHLDMDAFFASVEIRDDPRLQGMPVVVGGEGPRAVVAAASYPARERGVRSAMPMVTAKRLCPQLVIVPPRIDHYRAVSREVMAVLGSVVVDIEQVSVDEAFLDVRPARRLFGPPEQIAALLRSRIREELGLPSSVGGAVSRTVAKIASGRAKPDGMLIVPAERTAAFLAPLPLAVVPGIGPKAVERFQRLGVRRIGELPQVPAGTLTRVLGPRAEAIMRLATGQDRTGLGASVHDRSVGTERTWSQDVTDPMEARRRITAMADSVARTLRRDHLVARTVVLKLRAPDGTTITRSSTFEQPTDSSERMRAQALALWERERHRMPRLRLAGVRAQHVLESDRAGTTRELSGSGSGWHGLEQAWDRASERFGSAAVTRGSLLASGADAPGVNVPTREAVPRTTGEAEIQGEEARGGERESEGEQKGEAPRLW